MAAPQYQSNYIAVPTILRSLQQSAYGTLPPPPDCSNLSPDIHSKVANLRALINRLLPVAPATTEVKPLTELNDPAIISYTVRKATVPEFDAVFFQSCFDAQGCEATLLEIAAKYKITVQTPVMASSRFPTLTTSNLPPATSSEASATASPARGSAMLNNIFQKVRVPEFRFLWQFWAEKGQSSTPSSHSRTASKDASAEEYASRPKPLGDPIHTIKDFYQHFNNIPTDSLKLRDSIHLFHVGVKPLWEDPRNAKGGAWYFRVGKDVAAQVWHEICLLAVGDNLQGAVETKRESFNDDICGISYSVRWNAVQIAVWTRDCDNEVGKEKLLATILDSLSDDIKPKKDSYWYKAHKEHKGFVPSS